MTRIASRRIVGGAAGSKPGADVRVPTTVQAFRHVQATVEAVRDPAQLARLLNEMQLAAREATAGARSSPELGAIILGPYKASGAAVDINHGLGRAPVAVTCVRAIGAAWTGYEVDAAVSKLDARRTVRVQFPATGTFYLRFA